MAIDPNPTSWWETIAIGALSILTVVFGYTHKRIRDVEKDIKGDLTEEVKTLRQQVVRLEQRLEDFQSSQAHQHTQNLERLNGIPTRDEVMRLFQSFMRQQ